MDYYDTTEDDDLCGGLGGFDMMDDCYGDHCAFSKYILGWIEPTEVTGEQTYYLLTPLGERGDALLLRKPGTRTGRMSGFLFDHAYGGVYGEYLLIETTELPNNMEGMAEYMRWSIDEEADLDIEADTPVTYMNKERWAEYLSDCYVLDCDDSVTFGLTALTN